ncbi:hypothetical protein BATDEDRAFT_91180 [Batrachochytrium dendrobatidis JAM81]|uniref:Extracellular membrane protein CFEM domain-containing protein n=2 Tax=Batrachochytrium dendrobatidis TaxID=109871 RepID=F4P9Y4_BATDJ|nr:uncharacterized protein BATDEDRAFT_91180 [Batrachochytrium dendrobatidis JAM81]EGF78055.1 hypothetical protein BATDEDRAFT_91180 [Batrachochytrium dendrobatidis JAM81]KAJ8330042.1 hypothetical protein O5D80_001620 [Batrachochytrium dendrobatidis]KAK5670538.1 hypothetical protein QVD99_003217 [Batrachochytrium dendrobatidis]OAJ44183.1 hypothetical protein BDEG_27447 [Batrachochytrium dendrobatidis JEL423]|eukprot:XP_006681565.1 hypothetical protein BATDEDRAFT_91180 [Batrachochytrium dendrobatidis JAM81]
MFSSATKIFPTMMLLWALVSPALAQADPVACTNCLALCQANWIQTEVNCQANDTPQCRAFQCSYDMICRTQCNSHFQCNAEMRPQCLEPSPTASTPASSSTTSCSAPVMTVTTTQTSTLWSCAMTTTIGTMPFAMDFEAIPTEGLAGYPQGL